MTDKAKELLSMLVSAYDQGQKNEFDFAVYMGFSDRVIDELVNAGCIVKLNDISATIKLTEFGYAEAKK